MGVAKQWMQDREKSTAFNEDGSISIKREMNNRRCMVQAAVPPLNGDGSELSDDYA